MEHSLSEIGNEELSMGALKKKYGPGMAVEDDQDELGVQNQSRKNSYEDTDDPSQQRRFSILHELEKNNSQSSDLWTNLNMSTVRKNEKQENEPLTGKKHDLNEKAKREERALKRYEMVLKEWENVASHLSKKLGKKETDLVMQTSSSDFRTRREEAELLENSKPANVRYGPLQWEMTLRGDQESQFSFF